MSIDVAVYEYIAAIVQSAQRCLHVQDMLELDNRH